MQNVLELPAFWSHSGLKLDETQDILRTLNCVSSVLSGVSFWIQLTLSKLFISKSEGGVPCWTKADSRRYSFVLEGCF